MHIGVPRERHVDEHRVGLTPAGVELLTAAGPYGCRSFFGVPFSLSLPASLSACRNRYSIWPFRLRNSSLAHA